MFVVVFFYVSFAVCRHAVNVANCNPVFGSYASHKTLNEEYKRQKNTTHTLLQTIDSFHSIKKSMVFAVAIETMNAKWLLRSPFTISLPHCRLLPREKKNARRISRLNLDEFWFHLFHFVWICIRSEIVSVCVVLYIPLSWILVVL